MGTQEIFSGDVYVTKNGVSKLFIGREINFLIKELNHLFTHVSLHSEPLLNRVLVSGQSL